MPRTDILGDTVRHAEAIIKMIEEETDDQQEGQQMLYSIKASAKGIIEKVQIMKRYREIRSKSIYVYYPEDDVYQEANRNQKIKIARRLLINEGKIIPQSE